MFESITQAINCLKSEKIICFPTETVFALACDAGSNIAVDKVYRVKGRGEKKPLAVFVKNIDMAEEIIEMTSDIKIIMSNFCPGPITIIAKKKENNILSPKLNQLNDTIAIRIPDHPFALELLNRFNSPIAATSCNISGESPANSASEIGESIANNVAYIVQCEQEESAMPSTIIDMTTSCWSIIRQGNISVQQIKALI